MYYPLSQITTNLYTNGSEYTESPEVKSIYGGYIGYTGFYWKTSQGLIFTGKNPSDTPNNRLYPIKSSFNSGESKYLSNFIEIYNSIEEIYLEDSITNINILNYITIKNINPNQKLKPPYYFSTLPTPTDYQTGEYTRYFCKKINELMYIEISKDYYTKLTKQDVAVAFEYYLPFNIPWRLTGNVTEVYNINKNIVLLTMKKQKLPMFNKYLKEDYTKYYK